MSVLSKAAGVLLLAMAAVATYAQERVVPNELQRGMQPETEEPAVKSGHQYVVASITTRTGPF
jgi:hypothetical protein